MMLLLITLVFLLTALLARVFNWNLDGTLCCGLAGFTGNKPVDPYKLKMLLMDNTSRGKHSTGVYGNQLFRLVESADKFIKHPSYMLAVKGARTVISHTRHATMGAHTKENAHPFNLKRNKLKVVGTHNGWLVSSLYNEMIENCKLKEKPEVDSVAIYEHLLASNMDINSLAELEGAIALAYVHDKKLYLYRRSSKPLFIGETDEGIYYSSREEGLEQIDVKGIHELEANRLYEFTNGIITTTQAVKQPILSLKMDCSPSAWDVGLSLKDKERLEEKFPKWAEALEAEKKKTKTSYINGGTKNGTTTKGFHHGATTDTKKIEAPLAQRQLFSPDVDSPFLDQTTYKDIAVEPFFKELEKTILTESKRVIIPKLDHQVYDSDDWNSCHIICNVFSEVNGVACPYWLVKVEGLPIQAITDVSGIASLKIPKANITDNKLQILIIDPFDETQYVASEIDGAFTGKVLEVAFPIPFRSNEELSDGDRLNFGESALLRRCYRNTVQPDEVKKPSTDKLLPAHEGRTTSTKRSNTLTALYEELAQLNTSEPRQPSFSAQEDGSCILAKFSKDNFLMIPLRFHGTDDLFPDVPVTDWGLPKSWDSLSEDEWQYFKVKMAAFHHKDDEDDDHEDDDYMSGAIHDKQADSWYATQDKLDDAGYISGEGHAVLNCKVRDYFCDTTDEEFNNTFTYEIINLKTQHMDNITKESLQRAYNTAKEEVDELETMLDTARQALDIGQSEEDLRSALADIRGTLSAMSASKTYTTEHIRAFFPSIKDDDHVFVD